MLKRQSLKIQRSISGEKNFPLFISLTTDEGIFDRINIEGFMIAFK
jgi:hypothetical protein